VASKKDQLFEIYDQGFAPKSPEAKAIAPNSKTRYNTWYKWRDEQPEPPPEAGGPEGSPEGAPSGGGGASAPAPKAGPARGPGGGVAVGKILIVPDNWYISQEGALIILDTFIKDKQNISYGGTVGEHIVDVFRFYRRVMKYEEVDHDGISQGGQGGGGNGAEGVGPSANFEQR
jgi:hypothetical protein